MGFACFICREQFNENTPTEKGGGDGFHLDRSVSATKCGHLFHTECLKRVFSAQCQNAWAAKSCPACEEVVQACDVWRVCASPYDKNAGKRPTAEDLLKLNKKLQDDNADLLRQVEFLYMENREMRCEISNTRRDKEELNHIVEQLKRINSAQLTESERLKAENERLKNIIITLSERLTGNCAHENGRNHNGFASGTNFGDSQGFFLGRDRDREQFSDTANVVQRLNDLVVNSSINNGTMLKASYPPGLLFPNSSPSENGTEGGSSPLGNTANSISPDASSKSGMIGNRHHQTLTCFSMTDFPAREYEQAFESEFEKILPAKPRNGNLPAPVPITVSTSGSVSGFNNANGAQSPEDSHSPGSFQGGFHNGNGQLEEQQETQSQMADKKEKKSSSAASAFLDSLLGKSTPEEETAADNDNGKWHTIKNEKKNRSRGQSKSDHRSSKSERELLSDKKLYGSFSCPTCHAKWGSSHSVLNTPQTCRYCKTVVHPYNQEIFRQFQGPILSRKLLESAKK